MNTSFSNVAVSSASGQSYDWSTLPRKHLLKVFESLSPEDLCRADHVCRNWRIAANEPHLWKRFYPSIYRIRREDGTINWKMSIIFFRELPQLFKQKKLVEHATTIQVEGSVEKVALAPNDLLACSLSGGDIKICSLVDKDKEEVTYSAHSREITGLTFFNPYDMIYLVSSSGKSVKIWNPDNKKLVHTFRFEQPVSHLIVEGDFIYLLEGSNKIVKLWRAAESESWESEEIITRRSGKIIHLAANEDSVFFTGSDSVYRIIGKKYKKLFEHTFEIKGLVLSESSVWISDRNGTHVWDIKSKSFDKGSPMNLPLSSAAKYGKYYLVNLKKESAMNIDFYDIVLVDLLQKKPVHFFSSSRGECFFNGRMVVRRNTDNMFYLLDLMGVTLPKPSTFAKIKKAVRRKSQRSSSEYVSDGKREV